MPHLANSTKPFRNQASPVLARRVWPGRLLLLMVLTLVGAVFWQRQAVSDWIQLYGYEPPARIAQLADQTTMDDGARHLFYLNKPLIAGKSNFGQFCTDREHTIVLGCYHSGQDGIYILNIDKSSELHGVMQVTAAHEMLHAAYERLSDEERSRVNALLQDYFDNGLTNKAVKAEVESYRKTEPNSLRNEMHSIFGTEIAKLPAELEEYYSQYFIDRQAVVAQAKRYQDAFRRREATIKLYDVQLAKLKTQISTSEANLNARAQQLKQERARLEAARASGNISAYNSAVPGYNSLVRTYNNLLADTKQKITQYNVIIKKRNVLVVEEKELMQQLSGSDLPAAQ